MSVKYIHTNIVSKNWKILVNFYVNVFECTILPPERNLSGDWIEKGTGVKKAKLNGVHLRLPGFKENAPTLEVFQYAENEIKALPAKANREGFGHIAFHVDDVEQIMNKIIKHGGAKLGEIVTKDFPNGKLTFVYATDPEGNIVEVQNWELL